ncbi:MAG: adenylate kinase [Bacteroidetes bacterium]|nr:MAG: adenylate kinase [Bacteroidota bacterium]
MLNLILFGPPGSGKGTQSLRVACRYNLVHFSSGELFRNEVKKGTKIGYELANYMINGLLVPDFMVLRKIYRAALQYQDAAGIVFDGFPRTVYQAEMLDKLLIKKDIPISIVFFMMVDEKELISRMMGRAEDSGRLDDNEEIILRRMEVYEKQTLPMKEYYQKQGKLSCISGMAPVKVVAERISRVIDHYLMKNEIIKLVAQ